MEKSNQNDRLVTLAQEAVEEYVRFGRIMNAPVPVPPELEAQAGAFVCLKKNGQLRGCIGTIEATQPNLGVEIIRNAVNAAVEDPRFEPVTIDELSQLQFSVDVLSAAEPVQGLEELDPKIYGVIVESGYKRGLLLPDLDGVDTVESQVGIAMRKAGIRDGESISLFRFQVTRHE